MLLLLFLLLSEGAAEGELGLALAPSSALKRKGGHEMGGRGLGDARTDCALGSRGPWVGQHQCLVKEVTARPQKERPSGLPWDSLPGQLLGRTAQIRDLWCHTQ